MTFADDWSDSVIIRVAGAALYFQHVSSFQTPAATSFAHIPVGSKLLSSYNASSNPRTGDSVAIRARGETYYFKPDRIGSYQTVVMCTEFVHVGPMASRFIREARGGHPVGGASGGDEGRAGVTGVLWGCTWKGVLKFCRADVTLQMLQ